MAISNSNTMLPGITPEKPFFMMPTVHPVRIDSVYENNNQKGKVQMPATFGAGFSLEKEHVLLGADFETTQWDNYRFFGQKDLVKNNWTAKFGVQYFPASVGTTGYFNFVKYRAGFSFGNDYIDVGKNLPVYTISVGGAFPLKLKHSFYDLQYSMMNLAFEYGNRGNNNNNITENIYKICCRIFVERCLVPQAEISIILVEEFQESQNIDFRIMSYNNNHNFLSY